MSAQEVVSSTAGGVAGTIATAAIASGMQGLLAAYVWSALVGFGSGLVALLFIPPDPGIERTPARVFLLVAASAFLAGVFAPILTAFFMDYFQWTRTLDHTTLRIAAAAVIGGGVHVPSARRIFMSKVDK